MASDIEVLLDNDDITVLGPPQFVDLSIDIGSRGVRGSQIFVGTGNPNNPLTTIGQTPELNDLFINSAPGPDYAYMYQYVSQPGGNSWIEVLKINPTLYNENHLVTFTAGTGATSGSGEIIIPIEHIITVDPSSLTAANFNVQATFSNSAPVAHAIQIPAISGENLIIDIEASEYASGTWQALEGEITVHIFISITF